jgi:hypothetical protein
MPRRSGRRLEDDPELMLATGTTVGPRDVGCPCVISGGGGGPDVVAAGTTAFFFLGCAC